MRSSNVIATANTLSLSDSIRCKLQSATMLADSMGTATGSSLRQIKYARHDRWRARSGIYGREAA